MLRLRPYKPTDAATIISWCKDEISFRKWTADRYETFPITEADMNRKYIDYNGDCTEPDNFYPMTAFDDDGIVGHLILRFTDEKKSVLRLGFVIMDDAKRGMGYGRKMISLSIRYAFEILKVEKVTLGVFENNMSAYRCYKAAGFQESKAGERLCELCGEQWKCIELELGKDAYQMKLPDSTEKNRIHGIALFGPNGAGKSTLAHALAGQTDYFEMDAEDYYFPSQRASRRSAQENTGITDTGLSDELPFSNSRTKQEVENAIAADVRIHPKFILSGVTMNWNDEILSHIDLAFWVRAPLKERLKRIQSREEKRFGSRVLAGEDMYAQQMEFRKMVENRDADAVEKSAERLSCPILFIDGTLPVPKNLEKMMAHLNTLPPSKSEP